MLNDGDVIKPICDRARNVGLKCIQVTERSQRRISSVKISFILRKKSQSFSLLTLQKKCNHFKTAAESFQIQMSNSKMLISSFIGGDKRSHISEHQL